jgi:hypothetical protein
MMEERAWKIFRDVERKGAAIEDIPDIYWMAALHKDGHPSSKDCLIHYLLPGPSDWWSRTLISRLRDLAGVEGRGETVVQATVLLANISKHQSPR